MAKDLDIELNTEVLEDVGGEARVYELGFHLDPELPVEEVKKAYQGVRALIEGKGTLVAEGEPQKIQLAYTISRQEVAGRRDFDSAYFAWVAYEMLVSDHADLLTAMNADTHIVRFIDLLTTKDAARHAVEMHELSMKAREHVEDLETDTDAGAELDAAP